MRAGRALTMRPRQLSASDRTGTFSTRQLPICRKPAFCVLATTRRAGVWGPCNLCRARAAPLRPPEHLVLGVGQQGEVDLLCDQHHGLKRTAGLGGKIDCGDKILDSVSGDFGARRFEEVDPAELAIPCDRYSPPQAKIPGGICGENQQAV